MRLSFSKIINRIRDQRAVKMENKKNLEILILAGINNIANP